MANPVRYPTASDIPTRLSLRAGDRIRYTQTDGAEVWSVITGTTPLTVQIILNLSTALPAERQDADVHGIAVRALGALGGKGQLGAFAAWDRLPTNSQAVALKG